MMKYLGTLAAQTLKATCLLAILAACNGATAQVITAEISPPSSDQVRGLTANPVTNKVYFGSADPHSNGLAICVLPEATNQVICIPLPANNPPTVAAINSVTNKVYAIYDNKIAVIDGVTDTIATTIALPFFVYHLALNEKTNRLYVSGYPEVHGNGPALQVIDGATNTLTTSIPTPDDPYIIKTNPITNKIYITYLYGSAVSVVDGATNAIKTIDLYGSTTTGLAINTFTNKVYVTQKKALNVVGDGSVWVIDGATDTIQTARFIGQPAGYAFANDNVVLFNTGSGVEVNEITNKIYMIANGVTVMDGATLKTEEIPEVNDSALNAFATDIRINPVLNKIYVGICCGPYGPNNNEIRPSYIAAIDGVTNLPSFIPVPFRNPVLAAVDPGSSRIYSAGGNGNNLYQGEITVFDAFGGSVPSLSLFPPSLSFNAPLNTPSAPQTFWISNLGGAPMTITNIEANNIFYPAYSQSNNCPHPLPALTSCPVSLVYTPKPSPYNPQIGNLYVQTAAPTSPDRVTIDVTATVTPAP